MNFCRRRVVFGFDDGTASRFGDEADIAGAIFFIVVAWHDLAFSRCFVVAVGRCANVIESGGQIRHAPSSLAWVFGGAIAIDRNRGRNAHRFASAVVDISDERARGGVVWHEQDFARRFLVARFDRARNSRRTVASADAETSYSPAACVDFHAPLSSTSTVDSPILMIVS